MAVYILSQTKGVTAMKGCQKKVIFIKNTGNKNFDEAYFIISHEGESERVEEESLVSEANKIIEESLDGPEDKERRGRMGRLLDFAVPFLCGALLCALAFFVFLFVK